MNQYITILAFSIIWLCCVSLSYKTHAQEYIKNEMPKESFFDKYTVKEGMSTGNIFKIYQDSKGFIWFCTDGGINRFDGYDFKVYNKDPEDPCSISNDRVMTVFESADSTMWFGTDGGGVNIFDRKTGCFTKLVKDSADLKNSLCNDAIYAICEDKFGNMWFGSFGGGVSVYNRKTGKFKNYQHNKNNIFSLAGNSIRDIVLDNDKNVWVGVDGGGLSLYDNASSRFINFQHDPADPTTLGSNIVLDIQKDRNGHFWIGSWEGGVSRFDPVSKKNITVYKNDPDNDKTINHNTSFNIAMDHNGQMWISTWNGLNLYNEAEGTFTHFVNDPLLSSSLINNIMMTVYVDRFGCLWGTGGGVNKLDLRKKKFHLFRKEFEENTSISDNKVVAINYYKGKYYIGTQAGGVTIADFKNGEYRTLKNDPDNRNSLVSDQKIEAIEIDSQGNVWFGTNGSGISIYNPETGNFKNLKAEEGIEGKLQHNVIKGLLSDNEGNMWVGLYAAGINYYDSQNDVFKHFDIDTVNKQNNVVVDFAQDSKGRIWAATVGHGLALFEKETETFRFFKHISGNENTICSNNLNCLHIDAHETLWIGTRGGMSRMDLGTFEFTSFNVRKDSLPSDNITAIISEGDKVWVSSINGLFEFDAIENKLLNTYDETDGLQGNSFYPRSAYYNGTSMLFGGHQGITAFHPDSIKKNNIAPTITFTGLTINNEKVDISTNGPLRADIPEAKQLYLTPDHKSFTIHFSVMHFAQSEKNKIRYMLEGFDEDWIETDHTKRFATYTNLSGGEYTFRVIGSNADGKWNTEGSSLKITVEPPFYATIWFYILIGCAIVGLFYIYVYFSKRRAKFIQKRLQMRIDAAVSKAEEQTKELEKQNLVMVQKQEAERKRNWINTGKSEFTAVLKENKGDLNELCSIVLQKLIQYIGAIQGGVFVLNENNPNDRYLQLTASYAYEGKRFDDKRIEIGETLVGNCFKEEKMKKLYDFPENFLTVSSSLGSSSPQFLFLCPLTFDEKTNGVIELSFFEEPEDYMFDFINEFSEIFAAQLYTAVLNDKTKHLLDAAEQKTVELEAIVKDSKDQILQYQSIVEELENRLKRQ